MRLLQKTAALWAGLSMSIILLASVTDNPAAQQKEIRLRWAFGALTGPSDHPQLMSIEENAVLHSGDRMKIFLHPQTDCFLYLFYRSSQGEIAVMLPAKGSGSRAAAGTQTAVPPGSDWFRLDEVTGSETFYLLVSARPLDNLETLCRSLHAATRQTKRAEFGRQILSEISRLQNKHRSLTAAAERPIRLGGNFRGMTEEANPQLPDVSRIAMEISTSEFYSRTFTIDHR